MLIRLTVCLPPAGGARKSRSSLDFYAGMWEIKFRKGAILMTSIEHCTVFSRGKLPGEGERVAFPHAVKDTASACLKGAWTVHTTV